MSQTSLQIATSDWSDKFSQDAVGISDCYLYIFQALLKIAASEWSDKFSLDTVGSSGDVQCKSSGKQSFIVSHFHVEHFSMASLLDIWGIKLYPCLYVSLCKSFEMNTQGQGA